MQKKIHIILSVLIFVLRVIFIRNKSVDVRDIRHHENYGDRAYNNKQLSEIKFDSCVGI